ncbi:hypothetical protein ZWY2020_046088 [Hordeum vulgare]|nr:hypothetical protein ZWY2020_046088 [Hordeum vulgare]
MGSLLPKLLQLLNEEVKLQKGVKERVRSLEQEMRSMQAVLQVVGEVPREQLDAQVKLWAGEVRELSFKIEDVVDKFLVNVDDGSEPAAKSNKLKRLTKKMAGLFTNGKDRHQIAHAIKDINKQVQEALYTEVTELVGIDGKRDQALMELLSNKDDVSNKKLKIVSVVGFGGLGKTTLVKTVYDKIKGDFDCRAFVSVGRKADPRKVLMDILLDLDVGGSQLTLLDETQLVKKLREYLEGKRYLIVIDDIWDAKLWTVINYAFSKGNNAGFVVLRVLNLSGCRVDKDNLGGLWSLVHLRYLGLSGTRLCELPKEVGKLQFLQVLDVSRNGRMVKLPSSVTKLRRSMCLLYEESCNRLPDGIGNLTAMEEFSCIHVDSLSIVKEMGNMKRLRKFEIQFGHMSLEFEEAFVKSLEEMSNVQSVTIIIHGGSKMMDLLGEKWVPPRGLQVFDSRGGRPCRFSRLPAWIRENPSQMSQLSMLYIGVKEVQQVDLGLLGRLPTLHALELESLRQGPLLVEADGFRCITLFCLWSNSPGQVVFQPGALPKVEEVWLRTGLPVPKEEADGNNGGELFDTGIRNLQPSLRYVRVEFCTSLLRKEEAEEAKWEWNHLFIVKNNVELSVQFPL